MLVLPRTFILQAKTELESEPAKRGSIPNALRSRRREESPQNLHGLDSHGTEANISALYAWVPRREHRITMQISQSIRRFLVRLGPYQSLLVLAVPLAIIEPLKVLALLVVGDGHFIAGTLVMIGAYAGSLFFTERLFKVLKPSLLSLSWFAKIWIWFVTARDKTHA